MALVATRQGAVSLVVMRKGDELLKYCRRSKPHVCHFSLSADECELQWVSKNGTLRRLRFDQVSDVVAGRGSSVFRLVAH